MTVNTDKTTVKFLTKPDNTDTELGRLKKLDSFTDPGESYRSIYNFDIETESLDINTVQKSLGDTTKAPVNTELLSYEQILAQNSEISTSQNIFSSQGYTSGTNTELGRFAQTGPATTNNVQNNVQTVETNKLHEHTPVNYIITLSCIGKSTFNNGQGDEIVIFRSGGKVTQGQGVLSKDYYVDNLVIRNTMSPTKEANTGSIFQVLFNVIEPYGTSFVDALIEAATSLGWDSHLQAVYNIKIEFKGENNGQPINTIPQTTRNIPIHLYQVEMQIDAGVTSYAVQAAPATYLALTDLYSHIQESVTCSGNTVGDLIENFFQVYNQSLATLQNAEAKKILLTDVYKLDRESSMSDIISSEIGWDEKSGFGNNITVSNIDFDPRLSNRYAKKQITVPKGTQIKTFIEEVVKESMYYRNQFDTDGKPKTENLKTLRTETQLKVGEPNGNNRPQYTFSYVLREQIYKSSIVVQETEDLASGLIPQRVYNYLFTGENQDVLNFDITYKFAYYQALPYLENKGNDPKNDTADGDATNQDGEINSVVENNNDGVAAEPINQEQLSFLGVNKENGQIVNVMQQIIQDPTADLIATNLEILGDPHWISQMGVLNRSFKESFQSEAVNTDEYGAVRTDQSQVIVQVNFKTPTDLNDETGLFSIEDAAFFQGKYQVYMAENRFESGMYTTVLSMVRMRNQPNKLSKNDLGQQDDSIEKTPNIPIGSNIVTSGGTQDQTISNSLTSDQKNAFGGYGQSSTSNVEKKYQHPILKKQSSKKTFEEYPVEVQEVILDARKNQSMRNSRTNLYRN